MDNVKEIFEINEKKEEYFLSRVINKEIIDEARVRCGASDSYFEDM